MDEGGNREDDFTKFTKLLVEVVVLGERKKSLSASRGMLSSAQQRFRVWMLHSSWYQTALRALRSDTTHRLKDTPVTFLPSPPIFSHCITQPYWKEKWLLVLMWWSTRGRERNSWFSEMLMGLCISLWYFYAANRIAVISSSIDNSLLIRCQILILRS